MTVHFSSEAKNSQRAHLQFLTTCTVDMSVTKQNKHEQGGRGYYHITSALVHSLILSLQCPQMAAIRIRQLQSQSPKCSVNQLVGGGDQLTSHKGCISCGCNSRKRGRRGKEDRKSKPRLLKKKKNLNCWASLGKKSISQLANQLVSLAA